MQINRWVKLVDLCIFGGLFIFSVVCGIFSLITPQEWNIGKSVSLICCVAGFSVPFILFLIKLICGKPSYVTKQGTMVWLNNTNIPKSLCEEALEFFVINFHIYYLAVTEGKLRNMLSKTNLIFSKDPLDSLGKGYYLKNNAGLQSGYNIAVCSKDNKITATALFHELIHESEEMVLNLPTDYKHTDPIIWNICKELELLWSKLTNNQ